jgi:hypothetical protein
VRVASGGSDPIVLSSRVEGRQVRTGSALGRRRRRHGGVDHREARGHRVGPQLPLCAWVHRRGHGGSTASEHLGAGMNALAQYVSNVTQPDPIVQLAIARVEFGAPHPFRDGNVRLGRMLIPLFLVQRRSLGGPSLSMSGFFERHRDGGHRSTARGVERRSVEGVAALLPGRRHRPSGRERAQVPGGPRAAARCGPAVHRQAPAGAQGCRVRSRGRRRDHRGAIASVSFVSRS